jgi:hypothetical protein
MRLPDVISIQNRFALDAQPLWPLRSAISATNRVEVLEAAQWLIEHGADAALKDDLCKSDAVGTASYLGKAAVRDYLGSIRSGNRRAQRPQGLRIQCKAVLYTDHVRETHQRNPGSLHGGTPLGRTKS